MMTTMCWNLPTCEGEVVMAYRVSRKELFTTMMTAMTCLPSASWRVGAPVRGQYCIGREGLWSWAPPVF